MRKVRTKKTLRAFNREETDWKEAHSRDEIRTRDERSQEGDELLSVTKTIDWSPEELARIWRNTSG